MYKKQGQLKQFNELKPKLNANQQSLINAFYRLSQERKTDQGAPASIRDKDIREHQLHNGSCSYAPDLFIMAIHALDSEHITQYCVDMKRKVKKG